MAADAPLPPLRKIVLALEVIAAYPRARLAVRRSDIRSTVETLRGGAAREARASDPATLSQGLRLGRAVARTLRPLPVDSRCLTQALVLTNLLARRGIGGSVVIGVRPGPDFAAHAWVELGGRALLPEGAGEYERLVEL